MPMRGPHVGWVDGELYIPVPLLTPQCVSIFCCSSVLCGQGRVHILQA